MTPDKLANLDGATIPHLCKEDNHSSYLMFVGIPLPEALRIVTCKENVQ